MSKSPSVINVNGLVQPSEDSPFMISAGNDRKIRFWDLKDPEASYVVNGLEPEEASPKISYENITIQLLFVVDFSLSFYHIINLRTSIYKDTQFTIEHTPAHSFSVGYSSQQASHVLPTTSTGKGKINALSSHRSQIHRQYQRPVVGSSISSVSRGNFVDSISDLLLSQVPYPIIIASSFDGIVNVYK